MSDHRDSSRDIHEKAKAAFDGWLYPNMQFKGGAHRDDFTGFGHLEFDTDDSIQQVRSYYWGKIIPQRPVENRSVYKMDGDKPWFIVRSAYPSGGSWMGMYVTQERSLSIFAATEEREGNVKVLITWEDH